jgi:hypothetical protein
MHNMFVRALSRVLIVCISALSLQAQAGMIGTDHAAAAGQAQAARATLVSKLQAYGVAPDHAQARVAALTDAEALSLADRIADAPAGADAVTIAIIFVVLFLIWRFAFSDQAKASHQTSEPAKK